MSAAANRNLLFGILALQMNFVRADDLVAAMHAWVFPRLQPFPHAERLPGPCRKVRFSRDGRQILALVWPSVPLPGPQPPERTVARSGEIAGQGAIVVLRAEDLQRVGELTSSHPLTAADFSPDGKRIAAASNSGRIVIWEIATQQQVVQTAGEPLPPLSSLVFSPDGSRIVAASNFGGARIWDAATGQPTTPILAHADSQLGGAFDSTDRPLDDTAFSPDGKLLVTTGGDRLARLWEADTGRPLGVPLPHQDEITSVAFDPTGKYVLTASLDRSARLWEVATGRRAAAPLYHAEAIHSAQFAPDGRHVVTASQDGTARIWDVAAPAPQGAPGGPAAGHFTLAVSPSGRWHVSRSREQDQVQLWNTATGQPAGEPWQTGWRPELATFSSDEATLALATGPLTAPGFLRLFNTSSQQPVAEALEVGGRVHAILPSPARQYLVVVAFYTGVPTAAAVDPTAWGSIMFLETRAGQPARRPVPLRAIPKRFEFSADGRRLLIVLADLGLEVHDVTSGQVDRPVSEPVLQAAMHPRGDRSAILARLHGVHPVDGPRPSGPGGSGAAVAQDGWQAGLCA
jgi:WD40 repeat protein